MCVSTENKEQKTETRKDTGTYLEVIRQLRAASVARIHGDEHAKTCVCVCACVHECERVYQLCVYPS